MHIAQREQARNITAGQLSPAFDTDARGAWAERGGHISEVHKKRGSAGLCTGRDRQALLVFARRTVQLAAEHGVHVLQRSEAAADGDFGAG
jgi:hypothetical protein